ncbi:hypothetical protein [Parasitella parasitica]|uniref:Uncharacterized protein n=1 Tax=Parasitella parasitica TaxID=35722 RepID=A0A0B7NBW2_9FUNG|nr:hypothetical protein [Parasitella parasitica]
METNTRFGHIVQLISLRQRFDEPLLEILQRFIFLTTKAQVQNSVFMAIMCFSSLKKYVKTYLKAQLPTMRMAQRGSVTPPIISDAKLPHENLQCLMELLECHSSAVLRDLLDFYQKEVDKQTRKASERKRVRSDEASVDPNASADASSKPPAKRFDRKGHDAVLASKGLCTHCGKVEFYPGYFCPERIAFQNARQNAVNNSNNNNSKSRTVTNQSSL